VTPAEILLYEKPNQPNTADFPKQTLTVKSKTKTLCFQTNWFKQYPWLHFSPTLKAVVCYYCAKANEIALLQLKMRTEPAFITAGFTNWKNALASFQAHQNSDCHHYALAQHKQLKAPAIDAQLSDQRKVEQQRARHALVKVISTVKYLARQGLPLRGHTDDNGNFRQLLHLRADDAHELKLWLNKTTNYTSPASQNEILDLFSHAVIRNIVKSVKDESKYFALIVDGTQDCSGKEQESMCIRHVGTSMEVKEDFVGLYEPSDTTGCTLSHIVRDALIRLDLPLTHLRAQTYDGAANMAGQYAGCQKLIRDEQPLALYYHCSAHCANLVAEYVANSVPLVRDATQTVHEVGKLFDRSLKFRQAFREASDLQASQSLKPLCPTRWLCRVGPIVRVLDNYGQLLAALEAMACTTGDAAAKCNGLLEQFRKGLTVFGLKIAVVVFSPLEQLNRSLQAVDATVSGMLKAVETVALELSAMRSDDNFHTIMTDVQKVIDSHDLDEIKLPRARCPPRRYTGPAEAYAPRSVEEYYRSMFFELVDSAVTQINTRFSTDSEKTGLKQYLKLEETLLSGEADDLCHNYPELNEDMNSFKVQLNMFRNQFTYSNLAEAQAVLQTMNAAVRQLFPYVEVLVRLLLLSPATSCTAERSFSTLRRLKTWLRSTMTQRRLNAIAVCHTHQEVLDSLSVTDIAKLFAHSDNRCNVFGRWD